jgi:hypothetical protein
MIGFIIIKYMQNEQLYFANIHLIKYDIEIMYMF